MLVSDPLEWKSKFDFFSKVLHVHALSSVHSPWTIGSSYSIKTAVPLKGCEPLTGLRSLTTENFTAFSLQFQTLSGLSTEIAKYTNGCSGISAFGRIGDTTNVSLHAKSPGFDEYSSGSLIIENHQLHCNVQVPCLENLKMVTPVVTVGTRLGFAKHYSLIAQASSLAASRLKLGLKFQPCDHMHAGLGISLNDRLSVNHLEASVYAGLHSGATVAALGRFYGKSDFQFVFTQPVGSKREVQSEAAKVLVNQPVVGVRHDLSSSKTCAFIEMGVAATADSTRSIGLKLGVEVEGNKVRDPKLCFHITAAEA